MVVGNMKSHPALLGLFASRLPDLHKKEGSYWAKCIFHNEKTPSLNIGKDGKGEYVYHCFGCGVGGDAIQFVQAADKISFNAALKIVEQITGGNWEETKKKSDEVFRKLELQETQQTRYSLEEYAKFEIALYESAEAKEYLFRERGITWDTARKLHFGYCKSLESINKKYNPDYEPIKDSGWIITPAVSGKEVICIEARSIVEKKFVRKTGMNNKVLFGVDFVSWSDPVYVVEGHYDQAIMVQAGYKCVSLPSSQATITSDMRDLLMTASCIILAGDNDGGSGTNAMIKLWNEFQERTYRLVWPKGKKDANQTYLETCERDTEKFISLVDALTLKAFSNPLPGIKSIQDILLSDESDSAESREDRLVFSIPAMDKMANVFPGSVVYITASMTGSGKTQLTIQETLHAARKQGMIVLNYQTQLQGHEVGTIVTANLLAKDRNELGKEDRKEAAKKLKGVEYYVGHDPTLNTADAVLDLIEAGIRRTGANIVVLDLIHDIFGGEKDVFRAQEKAMRRIKSMSQKYLTIWINIGQPRKVDPKQQGKALSMYDSKGSEAIPSESDAVFYMHREPVKKMTEETFDKLSPEVEIHCMKARSKGKGGAFTKVFFLGKIATFREIANVREPVINNSLDF